jgi:hypothetical protein
MIKIKTAFTIVLVASLALGSIALAADAKTFRATGKLTKVNSTGLTVRTPTQDLEVTRDAKTKVSGGDLNLGKLVTVIYTKVAGRAYATEVTVRAADR